MKTAQDLAELEKATNELKSRRDAWDKKCVTQPWNEDNLYESGKKIKVYRKTITELSQKLAKEPDSQSTKDKINQLNGLLQEEQTNYAAISNQFKEYMEFSGIKIAEAEAKCEKLKKQLSGLDKMKKPWIFLAVSVLPLSLFCSILLAVLMYVIFSAYEWVGVISFFIISVAVYAGILYNGYEPVSEKEEWIIQFQGEYITTWEAGWHFRFPFFMEIIGKFFLGDTLLPLQTTQGGIDKVEFSDTSADIKANIYYRMFNSFASMYAVDDVEKAIAKKMEAGIRAYYGNMSLDNAIATREEVDLRKIITINTTEANKFKEWGVEIVSLVVTDIIVPPDIEEVRNKKIKAEKELEVSQVKQRQAIIEAETAKIEGQKEGNKLREKAKAIGKTVDELLSYELTLKKFEALGKSGMLIVSDDSKISESAVAGAAMGKGMNANQAPSATTVNAGTKTK